MPVAGTADTREVQVGGELLSLRLCSVMSPVPAELWFEILSKKEKKKRKRKNRKLGSQGTDVRGSPIE